MTDVWAELQESERTVDAVATPIAKALLRTARAPAHALQAPRQAKVETFFFLTALAGTVTFACLMEEIKARVVATCPVPCYLRLVCVRPLFAALLLAVCVGAPVMEMFDRWDHTLQDGNDTESNLVVVVLCVGVGRIAATALLRRVRPSWTRAFILPSLALPPIPHSEHQYLPPGFDANSPPLTLRI